MKTSDFDFTLPPELIAQEPKEPRDAARLMAHCVKTAETRHLVVCDLPELLRGDDLLVMNDTRVLPARLYGHRASGGAVEFLCLRPREDGAWLALARPAARLKPGEVIDLWGDEYQALALERYPQDDAQAPGLWAISLSHRTRGPVPVHDVLEHIGHMPLPPYIRRGADGDPARDRECYQTIYASKPGAVAAPTAGLHFTPELLERVGERGVDTAFVTLHVGPGTFRPVTAESIDEHVMHREAFELPPETAEAIDRCRARGGRVVAVGTTSVRVLESCGRGDRVLAGSGETDIFLHPGRGPRVVDALLTNFHLPRSTLLMLVAAFIGRERALGLYAEAVQRAYRFYSYGDAMYLER
ncbi:MAG TPA: tRNA preQ1(34) S-adenosylmethionine ribosyltransferase-isomerase QueA [Planctomycetota bacterium]|nr:tRNA preQ1(34) S-adenosylmethionine ribosyltransferase-isomerase QueA [Planctomycetota bacterium]